MLTAFLTLALIAPMEQENPTVLVQMLGSNSFEVRDRAEADLKGLGLAALDALEVGTRNPDIEIRTRSARLLASIREADRKARIQAFLDQPDDSDVAALPGWPRYRMLSAAKITRKTYVALYESDAPLLHSAAQDPRQATVMVKERARELGTLLLLPQKDRLAAAQLPALLYVMSDPAVSVEPATWKDLYAGLSILAQREALRKDLLTQPAVPELLLGALQRGGDALHATTLPLAAELALPQAHEWAVRLCSGAATPTATRAQAILLLARIGTPADIPVLVPLLLDKTPVGKVTVVSRALSAEMGDVALAAILHLNGEKPGDYGFPYFEAIPGLKTLPSPERLGFVDAKDRAAAFAKWREKNKR
jgi:hypothetical protein